MARKKIASVEALVHADVEIRTAGGGSYRGTLERLDSEFLYLLKTNGRSIAVARSAVVAIVDEQRLPGATGVLVSRETGEV